MDEDAIDFVVAAWREDGQWQVASLLPRVTESVDTLSAALRALPGEAGVFGMVSVADEFFVLARVTGAHVRLLLSDAACGYDWWLAEDVLARLDIELPDDDEEMEEFEPAGDVDIVSDLGMSSTDIELLCGDPELFPDQQLVAIATRLGFGAQLERVLDA